VDVEVEADVEVGAELDVDVTVVDEGVVVVGVVVVDVVVIGGAAPSSANQPSTSTTRCARPPPERKIETRPSGPTGTITRLAVLRPAPALRLLANGRGAPLGYTVT